MFLDTYRNLRDFFSDSVNAEQDMIYFPTQEVECDLYDKGMVFRTVFTHGHRYAAFFKLDGFSREPANSLIFC